MKNSLWGVLLLTTFTAFGCAEEDKTPVADSTVGESENEASAANLCPAGGSAMARTELFFGLSRANGPAITEAEFSTFVDVKVTPRFPDGLTLLSGLGQFRLSDGTIVEEGSKLLVLLHGGSKPESNNVEAIRNDYKTQFQQESVLRTDTIQCVSF
jgi:Protein of unknown function (DUF3574)